MIISIKLATIPLFGILKSGKTSFLTTFGWWLSYNGYGDLERESAKYISELITFVFKGRKVPLTKPKTLKEINFRLDFDKIPFINKTKRDRYFIKTTDISGLDYSYQDGPFLDLIDDLMGAIFLIDPLQHSHFQQKCAVSVLKLLQEKNVKIKNKPFLFLVSKYDLGHNILSNTETQLLFYQQWADIRKYLEKEGAHVSEMIFISSLGGKSEDIRIPKPYNFEKIIEFFFNEGEI